MANAPSPPTFAGIDLVLKQGSQALAEEIAALIESLDFDSFVPEVVQEQVDSVRRRLKTLARRAASDDAMTQVIEELKVMLAEYKPDAATWEALHADLSQAYEDLTSILTADDPDKPARPINYTRSLFHIGSAVFSLSLMLTVSKGLLVTVAGAFALWAWSAEIARRVSPRANALLMKAFRPVAHPSERNRVNSATWYVTALIGLSLTGSTTLMAVSVAVLGFGDPVAGIIGRRFGRTRLVHGRSLEGTLAFVVAAGATAFSMLLIVRPELSLGVMALVALGGAVAGALGELFSRSIDDNLSVPVAALLGTTAAMLLLGLGF